MTSGQKTALSLLISVVLFAAFALAAFAGLFSAIDARFYEPAKIAGIRERLKEISAASDEYLNVLEGRFALSPGAFLKNASVKSFVEARPSEADARGRSELLGTLRSETQGFLGLRILDKNQSSVHFSTFRSDILRRDEKNNLTAYKNYSECRSPLGNAEIPSHIVSCSDSGEDLAAGKKRFFDGENRIVFSFPLYDKYSVFRGTAVFYVNALDFSNFLLKKNLLSVGQEAFFLSNAKDGADAAFGYAFGLPSVGTEEFALALLDAWQKNGDGISRLFAIDPSGKHYWVSVSEKSEGGVFESLVCDDAIFSLSTEARALILACVFVSLFLISFLLLNLRRDDESVIRERIKRLQLGVVDEYLSKKEALDWEKISGRRDAVTKEIIQSLGRRAKKRPEEIEALINRSWDELFAAMNLKPAPSASGGLENAQELKEMLQEILANASIKVQAAPAAAEPSASAKRPAVVQAAAAIAEPVEELEEIADAEPVEELEEIPDAEPVEELEEIADAESVEELEEIPDAEPAEELEEIPDAEPAEELEEIPDAEPVEELEEIADAEPAAEDGDIASLLSEDGTIPKHAPEEMLDITEDVASDFFALKSDSAAPSRAQIKIQSDRDYDPFYRARDALPPNDETEALVRRFAAKSPSYKDLDARNEDQTLNGTFAEDKEEFEKDLSPEDFGIKVKEEKEDFAEVLDFGAPKMQAADDGFDVAATFTTESPRFERDPLSFFSGGKKQKSQEAKKPEAALAKAAIPVKSPESFLFSSFAQSAKVVELESADYSAIVQDSDGVFSIASGLRSDSFEQDNSFKRLVDSVLNKA